MTPRLYTYLATAIAAAALASAGAWRVQEWRWTAKTEAEAADRAEAARLAEEARQSDALQQRRFSDSAAGAHARTVAALNAQLGDTRAQLANLSDRQCLDAGTVRLLNATGRVPGGVGLRTPAGYLAGPAAAPAGPGADGAAAGDGYATERDTAAHIAICRSSYAALADQLNQILDIEDQRQAGQ